MEIIKILLVDDHPLVRDGLRARLEAVPHFAVVAEAGNAEQALHYATTTFVDLTLMDINLAGDINGIELTKQFHTQCPHVAVLMLSMHDKMEYVIQAMQSGARGYVLKDAPAQEIVNAIEKVMTGGVYYSQAVAERLSVTLAPDLLLTPREMEILRAIGTGKSNKHIARDLDLSARTVETHRSNIKRKLSIDNQADLIRVGLEQSHLKFK